VQKYENGTNRIGASRLQHIASIQQVSIAFFFEDAPGPSSILDEPCDYVSGFLAAPDGLALTKAYMHIQNAEPRRSIVALVKQIAGGDWRSAQEVRDSRFKLGWIVRPVALNLPGAPTERPPVRCSSRMNCRVSFAHDHISESRPPQA
jgi:hypothetical protein